ncbi:hypothetical protein [Ferruginibacter sp. SUN106]|uniref:hypothetical protein n=1 Tax=Ferruginibacter sp. SUN106 TaxID=2978348 RepID=UPI003D363C20
MKTYYTIIILLLFLPKLSHAQLTIKDFRLCVENIGCSDSILKISKQQLFKAGKVTANFPWLTIKSVILYFGSEGISDVTMLSIKGDSINNQAREYFKRTGPGTIITVDIEGYNKKNQRVPWANLSIRITQ